MTRMTAAEVVAELEDRADNWRDHGLRSPCAAYEDAAKIIRDHLVPRWQAEPDESMKAGADTMGDTVGVLCWVRRGSKVNAELLYWDSVAAVWFSYVNGTIPREPNCVSPISPPPEVTR